MLLLLISFFAGILTILAPCVLPLLPIIVGGSLSGNTQQKSRPYIIAGSLAVAVIFFTLLLKVSTSLASISPQVLTDVSGGLIIALGAVTVLPEVWEWLVIRFNFQARSQRFLGHGERNQGRFVGPMLIGLALGPVFSSCSPTYAFILASVLPRNFLSGLTYLIVYSIGLVLALLLISLIGRRIIMRFGWAVNTHSLFRRLLGILFIAIGLVIVSGHEVQIETWIANRLPFDETKVEQFLLKKQTNPIAHTVQPTVGSVLNVNSTPAPEPQGLTNWMNSAPLTLAQLHGKVVLVDFWTYSCVNCNRALPYVEQWYKTYQKDGLVVIGVHTPEFAFEHDPTNVQKFVTSDGITYPVALDNNYDTWNAFNNDSWPADYLIDKDGNIRYVALGEGDYDTTEKAIQELLGVHQQLQVKNYTVPISQAQTPETYFGTNRAQGYEGNPDLTAGTYTFSSGSGPLDQSTWNLSGQWQIGSEYITSEGDKTTLTFRTEAKDVYMVAGSANNQPITMTVGLPNGNKQYGPDAPGGKVLISGPRLYHIVAQQSFSDTIVTLTVPKGVSLYTFTFGS